MKVFPQGTYIAQTFIPKTSTILCSIAKGISKIYQLERELGLSEFIQRHQSSVIHSFIFIHSYSFILWWMKMTKMYLQSFVNFTQNDIRGTHLVFSKQEISRSISEILRVAGPLGEKFTFLNSLGTTKISKSLRLSVYINVVLLTSFPEQLKLFFYFKYWRSYKVL